MSSNPFDFEQPIAELDALISEFKRTAEDPASRQDALQRGIDIEEEIARVERKREEIMRQVFTNLTPWNEVQMARHEQRPYTLDYISLLCDEFVELHGDRVNADDPAIVGGLARFAGRSVIVIGHQKGRDLKERQLRNFGSARPAGFRKALRLMKLAEKFHKPVITFVDTPAAEANLMAEEEGISQTIAINMREMTLLKIPIIVAIIGEGGSGGALGIAMGDRIVMLEHAIYSVIPPESCAAILKEFGRDRARAPEAADALKLTAQNAFRFGVVDEVISEPPGGAHRNVPAIAAATKSAILKHLTEIEKIPIDALLEQRYMRYRRMGVWEESLPAAESPPD